MKTNDEIMDWLESNKGKLKKYCEKDTEAYSSFCSQACIYAMFYKMAEGKYEEIKPMIDKIEALK